MIYYYSMNSTDILVMNSSIYVLQSNNQYRECCKRSIETSFFKDFIVKISLEDIENNELYEGLRKFVNERTEYMYILDLSFINVDAMNIYMKQYEHGNTLKGYLVMIAMNDLFKLEYESKETINARITYLNLPTQIFDPSNIQIKAKAVHGN